MADILVQIHEQMESKWSYRKRHGNIPAEEGTALGRKRHERDNCRR
jgi:hypothetical protein